jgi:hypothetical protein
MEVHENINIYYYYYYLIIMCENNSVTSNPKKPYSDVSKI